MKAISAFPNCFNTTNGLNKTLNSGTYQHNASKAYLLFRHISKFLLPNINPLIPIQKDQAKITNRIRFETMEILFEYKFTERAKEAGSEANKKNRGPQYQPPYQLHHIE